MALVHFRLVAAHASRRSGGFVHAAPLSAHTALRLVQATQPSRGYSAAAAVAQAPPVPAAPSAFGGGGVSSRGLVVQTAAAVPQTVVPTSELAQQFGLRVRRQATRARDPERPKRPPSPWIEFLQEYRAANKSQGTSVEVMKSAASQWKGMSPAERRRWEEPYEAKKRAYDAEFKAYVESGKKDAWKRDPEKPKRPLTAFLRFGGEVRPQYQHLKVTEQSKEIASAWKNLPAEKKAVYEKAYAAEKAEFDKLYAAYKESGKEAAWKNKVGIKDPKEKAAEKMKEKKAAAAAKAKAKAETLKAAKVKAAKAKADKLKAAKVKAAKVKAAKLAKAKEMKAAKAAKEKAAKEAAKEKAAKVKAAAKEKAAKAKAAKEAKAAKDKNMKAEKAQALAAKLRAKKATAAASATTRA
eukprot:TRINITY_DN31100_c0_g1_i1.p1 TRINITY_DN31100_c0_g1~~TRINITY_DN31100_c0_g1_i1.p1  ORF type:complete len:410 (-),score=138.85 TRINITY_DN31100_c0_g1_i1:357-1586(-)